MIKSLDNKNIHFYILEKGGAETEREVCTHRSRSGNFIHVQLQLLSYPLIQTCVLGAQKNRLTETVLLSTHNMFWLRNEKNNFPVRILVWRSGTYVGNLIFFIIIPDGY